MSYSYETLGYFKEQRGEQGQFAAGDLLTEELSADDRTRLEAQNEGAADVVQAMLSAARDVIFLDHFGDHETEQFKIVINGHIQNGGSLKSYCQIRVECL